jgi:pimeloyl-ACP methyl ester carboxylesterase
VFTMASRESVVVPDVAPLWGELRYGGELARLLAAQGLRLRVPFARAHHPPRDPVLLIPGFMAGDTSLMVMRRWLARRGHPVATSGMRWNVDCAERIVSRLQVQVRVLAEEHDRPLTLIGQSRGGALARALAVRESDHVSRLVMLGSPVVDALAVAPQVLQTVRWMARLGDLGLPGLFSSECADGECCEAFWEDLAAPLPGSIEAVAVYSKSDAIVDWQSCIDPDALAVEVDSSHCGMSVHAAVYRMLEAAFEGELESAWNG